MVAVVQIADLHAEAGLIENGLGRGDVEAGHVVYLEGCERLRGGCFRMAFCRLASDFIVRLYFVERPSEKSPLLNKWSGIFQTAFGCLEQVVVASVVIGCVIVVLRHVVDGIYGSVVLRDVGIDFDLAAFRQDLFGRRRSLRFRHRCFRFA